jgi:anti-sigma28 factor (negative regulator of flagellin synthesis)
MIDPVEGVANTQLSNQSATATKASIQPKPHSSSTDTIQISAAAKAAMHEATETHAETNIKAKCGDLEAQRLIELKTAKRKLLGLD